MKHKLRIGILFGGKSAEHEISLQSARNILNALDKKKYEPVLLGITKAGKWMLGKNSEKLIAHQEKGVPETNLALIPGDQQHAIIAATTGHEIGALDVVFPVLHGPLGEDGTIQGLLKLMDVPFVGAGVLGSAVGMDKDVMKRLFRDAKIPTAKFLTFFKHQEISFKKIKKSLGLPLFIKPANLGSSVGITKAHTQEEFEKGIKTAFAFDTKILIEEYIKGRELECSVLGNENPKASVVGEIISHHEFYSYEAKYLDENGASLVIPAKISKVITKKIQNVAIKAFKILCLEGMARVDFFLAGNKPIINEVNTIPGFTNISMYPKLWEASGVSQTQLIDRLIQFAIERHAQEKSLASTRNFQ